ncbi:MAG TPA: ABC transporter permease [Longimicrobiales bacterium]
MGESGDERRGRWLAGAGQDVRYALRALRRSPSFSAVAVLTLALGIGANTAIFSVVDAVLLEPLPYAEAERLVMVWEYDRVSGTEREPASIPDYFDLRERSRAFEELAAFTWAYGGLVAPEGDPARVKVGAATEELLPMLGVRPVVGRLFTPAEHEPGAPRVAILDEGLWRSRFGSDPAVLGRTIELDGEPYAVVGVAPSGIAVPIGVPVTNAPLTPEGTDVWLPFRITPASGERSRHDVLVLGRLRPGATLEAAQADVATVARQLEAEYPRSNHGRGVRVEPLREAAFANVERTLLILLGAVGLVLLVACANVANLLLARSAVRAREVAVRAALGAGPRRLLRLFLAESLVLTLLAGGIGAAIAAWGAGPLIALAPPGLPRLGDVGVDARVLAFTLAVSLAAAVAFGLVPMFQARSTDLQAALARGGRSGTEGRRGSRFRDALVVAEVALSVVLVIGAGLLIRSLRALRGVDPGFRAERVVKLEFRLPTTRYPQDFARYPSWPEVQRFYAALLERARAVPGVRAAALAAHHPLAQGFTNSFVIEGHEPEAGSQPEIPVRPVTPGYFATLGIPLLRGRPLTDRDGPDAPAVLLINDAAAKRYFPGVDPIGKRIRFWGVSREIVGVVGNERFHGLAAEAPPAVYPPLQQTPTGSASLLAQGAADPARLVSALRAVIRELDPQLPVHGITVLDDALSASLARERFATTLLSLFAALAMTLAVIGVYGVLGYAVAQRTRELGIRLALGASPRGVVGLIVRRGMTLALGGIGLGVAAGLAASRLLAGQLFRVTPADPATYAAAAVAAATASLAACWLPARRATAISPADALRAE